MDLSRYSSFLSSYRRCVELASSSSSRLDSYQRQRASLSSELTLCQSCKDYLRQAKELLTCSSLRQCEDLATVGVRSIFGLDAKVVYDSDGGCFVLDYGNGCVSDLTTAQSGGVITVVSFVFTLYLILKLGSRRVMFLDEQWTQVSASHYGRFLSFVRKVCSDFDFDILLISHDARLTDDMCDRCYEISDGVAHRVK